MAPACYRATPGFAIQIRSGARTCSERSISFLGLTFGPADGAELTEAHCRPLALRRRTTPVVGVLPNEWLPPTTGPMLHAWGQNPASDVGSRMMAPTWDSLATGHDRSMRQWAVCTWSGFPYTSAPWAAWPPFTGRRGPVTPVGGPPSGAPFTGRSAI